MKLNTIGLIVVFLLLLLLALPLAAPVGVSAAVTIHYVSPSGLNTNSGDDTDHPWRSIQYAVDNSSPGDTIEVMDDNSPLTDDYIENVTVNKRLLIERWDDDETPPVIKSASAWSSAFVVTANLVTIRGLSIYGSMNSNAGIMFNAVSSCQLVGNTLGWDHVSHFNSMGILGMGSVSSIISGNTASYCDAGIFLYTTTGSLITQNTANSNTYFGIALDTGSGGNTVLLNTASSNWQGIRMAVASNGNTISQNTANSNGASMPGGAGIFLDSSTGNYILENTANSNTDTGISLDLNSGSNTVSDNETKSNTAFGIGVNSSSNTISGNTANSNALAGIRLLSASGNILESNTADSNNAGIYLDKSTQTIIKFNTTNSNLDSGIYLSTLSNDNSIFGNTANSNTNFGICLDSPSGNKVYNNIADSNQNVGIRLLNSNTNDIHGNSANTNGYHGIYLDGSNNNLVWDNTCNSNVDVGIFLDDSNNNTVWGNTCSANVKGLFANMAGNNSIHQNNFTDNTQYGVSLWANAPDPPVDAENNWWGDVTGPYDPNGSSEVPPGNDNPALDKNVNGKGDAVTDNVDYWPWLYTPVTKSLCNTVAGSGTIQGSATGDNIDIDATGKHTVCTALYDGDPYGLHLFQSTGTFYDVYLPDSAGVNSLTVRFSPATPDTLVYYRDGILWSLASDQHYDNGAIVVTITTATSPSLTDLTGLVFLANTSSGPIKAVGGEVQGVDKFNLLVPLLAFTVLVAAGVLFMRKKTS